MIVSIIVAVKRDNPNLRECIESCLRLDYPDFEILVLPDEDIVLNYPKTRVIPTGAVTPPIKRDLALAQARGEVVAFIDDDAYPAEDWLSLALKHFSNPEIAAVGGPAVTPETDSLMQKASGRIYSSYLMSGQYVYRYLPRPRRFVDDYPSCNFLVRKSTLLELGGFDTKFWPGEDTFLCLKIVRDLKKKIIYDPKVLVYHHRRGLFKGHLKQIANYGLHRGYFVKRFPQTSFKWTYFLPSLFVLGLFLGRVVSLSNPALAYPYFLSLSFYLINVLIFSIKGNPFQISPPFVGGARGGGVSRVSSDTWMAAAKEGFCLIFLVFWGIIFSHLVYGIYFIKGLLSWRLMEE